MTKKHHLCNKYTHLYIRVRAIQNKRILEWKSTSWNQMELNKKQQRKKSSLLKQQQNILRHLVTLVCTLSRWWVGCAHRVGLCLKFIYVPVSCWVQTLRWDMVRSSSRQTGGPPNVMWVKMGNVICDIDTASLFCLYTPKKKTPQQMENRVSTRWIS